ncbi:zinc finger protein OZF isoform X2 [Labeo rohita]|uniref:zinc finger protein OZF isoform X2 n=1 Tax=Labeo rohita TaxID=84645 RepID=UPI0021E2CD63|nr:zinc finger protein OZF isoform X2 [Labeo rohita]
MHVLWIFDDISQSKRQNGNADTDIKMNLTAAIRKITNSTAEHICRILHTASSGPRKDLTQPDQINHMVEQQTHIKDEEHVKGGDQQDYTSEVVSGIQESLNCISSGGHLLQTVEEETEFRFEEAFGHEEVQVVCQTPAVDESTEPSPEETELVDHQIVELSTIDPNSKDESNDISEELNTLDPPDIIETELDIPTEVQLDTSNEQNTCITCGKTFTHLNNLRRHEQKFHSGETPHACHECGERFASRRLLQIHRRVHKVEKPHKCTLCDKVFRLPNHLRNHMTSHGDERPFACSTCGKSFTLLSILRAHERTHGGEKNFVCLHCGSRFLTKSYLDYHQRVHTGEKPYLCKHCGKSFAQKGNLKAHERLHTGEQPFRCDECGKTFVHANTFKSHKQLHTGVKAFCCELCGKGFRRGTHLKTHLLTHSGDKPFSCDICRKTFALKGSLKTHKLTHTGQKSYACNVCNKQFTQASSLAKHKRVHTGEKPHRCENCNKCFSQSSHLKYHSKVCQSGTKSSANSNVEEN